MDITGRTALITGASSGIGAGLANALADRGADLVLVARSADRLERLATEGAGARVEAALQGEQVDLLVNNAGFGLAQRFVETDVPQLTSMVALNCAALTDLTSRYLPAMVGRGGGAVVNIASMGAYLPAPGMAVYAATKAYVLSLTQALWAETRGTGVRVTALCPTVTDTGFFDVAGERARAGLRPRTIDQVVATFLGALDSDRPVVVDGRINEVAAALSTLVPRGPLLGLFGSRMTTRIAGPADSPTG